MASLVPGLDNLADLAAIPVDIMRGDYMSALFDLVGVIPGIGELGDTAKLTRMGIKAAETADDVVDAARAVKTADNVVDAVKAASISPKGTELLNKVSNPKLKNTIKEMYRPGARVGDGGLADAIRHEVKTGKPVGGKSHIQKGTERLKNLERISKKETLTKQERKIVEDLIRDLEQALGGKS